MVSRGNLPGLRTNTKGTFSAKATGAPKIKPRDSVPITLVIPFALTCCTMSSIAA